MVATWALLQAYSSPCLSKRANTTHDSPLFSGCVSPKALRRHCRVGWWGGVRRQIVRLHSKYCALDENGDSMLSVEELKCLDELRANPFSHRICFLFSQDGR